MNVTQNQDPDAFAHGLIYLTARKIVRRHLPWLIRPWTKVKRLIWFIRYPTAESRFKQIHRTNYWANGESLSGEGSTLEATHYVRIALVEFIQKHQIGSLLDVPCGDFNWMKEVKLDIPYTGGDIVDELVARNQKIHATDKRRFLQINLTQTPLPKSDLLLSRDCLNHLSFQDIDRAIENIRASGVSYLAISQFPAVAGNRNQESGFTYRELNFCVAPFHWPPPLAQYDEQFHPGKHLAFWRIADLPRSKTKKN
jgi:hypothetical protein